VEPMPFTWSKTTSVKQITASIRTNRFHGPSWLAHANRLRLQAQSRTRHMTSSTNKQAKTCLFVLAEPAEVLDVGGLRGQDDGVENDDSQRKHLKVEICFEVQIAPNNGYGAAPALTQVTRRMHPHVAPPPDCNDAVGDCTNTVAACYAGCPPPGGGQRPVRPARSPTARPQ